MAWLQELLSGKLSLVVVIIIITTTEDIMEDIMVDTMVIMEDIITVDRNITLLLIICLHKMEI